MKITSLSNSRYALTYDVTVWESTTYQPGAPTFSGLTRSEVTLTTALKKNTVYNWQVVARNHYNYNTGPTWSFTTNPLRQEQMTYSSRQ